MFEIGGPDVILRRQQTIIFIVIPLAADWCIALHQYIEAHALLAVEVLH
jgi:hypothetical protein